MILCIALACILFTAFNPLRYVADDLEPRRISGSWVAAMNSGDLGDAMALYSAGAVLLRSSGERSIGTQQIGERLSAYVAREAPRFALHAISNRTSGDLGYERGTYEVLPTTPKGSASRGEYLLVLQRQANGDWKILEQVWTELGEVKKI